MGCTSECGAGRHSACVLAWCDCGCHHETIDAHHDGLHEAPDIRCQVCFPDGLGLTPCPCGSGAAFSVCHGADEGDDE